MSKWIYRSLLVGAILFLGWNLFHRHAHAASNLPVAKPIIIDDNPGGSVFDWVRFFRLIQNSETPVVVRGLCLSACTLVTMLPKDQTCIEPTASLGFHLSITLDDPDGDKAGSAAIFRRYYPQNVQAWLAKHKLTLAITYMSAAEVVKLDIMRPCTVSVPHESEVPR